MCPPIAHNPNSGPVGCGWLGGSKRYEKDSASKDRESVSDQECSQGDNFTIFVSSHLFIEPMFIEHMSCGAGVVYSPTLQCGKAPSTSTGPGPAPPSSCPVGRWGQYPSSSSSSRQTHLVHSFCCCHSPCPSYCTGPDHLPMSGSPEQPPLCRCSPDSTCQPE